MWAKEHSKLCRSSRGVSCGFGFLWGSLEYLPLGYAKFSSHHRCVESWSQPSYGSLISRISLLNFWLVAPNQNCRLEVAKLWVFPHPLGTEYATLSQQSCGVFTPNPSLCYNLESRTSGKNYKLITMLFLLTEKGMVEQKRPQNSSSSYPKLQHIYHLPFGSISGAQKWLVFISLIQFSTYFIEKENHLSSWHRH